MFIVAMLLISGGYAVAYWGVNNILSWEPVGSTKDMWGVSGQSTPFDTSSLGHGTAAAEMSLLLGVKKELSRADIAGDTYGSVLGRHKVPFPYKALSRAGSVRHIDNPSQPSGTNPNPVIPV